VTEVFQENTDIPQDLLLLIPSLFTSVRLQFHQLTTVRSVNHVPAKLKTALQGGEGVYALCQIAPASRGFGQLTQDDYCHFRVWPYMPLCGIKSEFILSVVSFYWHFASSGYGMLLLPGT